MSDSTPLILASASPRRRELLARLRVPFTAIPAEVEEVIPDQVDDPAALARDLARLKAEDVAARHPDSTVLGADTIVVLDGRVLGKPRDAADARATLRDLRGREHQTFTGIALVSQSDYWEDHVETVVHMRNYSDDEIAAYIESGNPFDKAGSYAIQAQPFRPVAHIAGCFCNVVGLPLVAAWAALEQAGIEAPVDYRSNLPPQCTSCPLLIGNETRRVHT